eukprot:TRINITY_DN2889_c0_g1_i5.p1 TRINITY_DN2889_c0_g1~~TRINITY_DN2889_c0_g1_i5.p1  ORF type:complete len:332 (-),score=51.31 TRINITY_DN2889_c0_g1_i5:109-1104(-)
MAAPSLDSQIAQQLMNLKGAIVTQPGGVPAPPGQALPSPATGVSIVLSAALEGMPCRYQLQEADVRECFGRWGPLQAVSIARDGSREVATITFSDPMDATDAQRQLHGFRCQFGAAGSGTLAVVPGGPEQLGGFQGVLPKAMGVPGMGPGGSPRPAWSCKIIVQAESMHPSFPVAAKIRGQDDANVGHMRTQLHCNVDLRGRGSGFLEPNGQELQEPMALWMAAELPERGPPAIELALDLLKSVYDEHAQWCQQNNQPMPPPIEAQLIPGEMLMMAMPGPGFAPGPPPGMGVPGQPPMAALPPPLQGQPPMQGMGKGGYPLGPLGGKGGPY